MEIALHVQSDADIKEAKMMLKRAIAPFAEGNIKLQLAEVKWDVPRTILTYDRLLFDFRDLIDDRRTVHIFLVDSMRSSTGFVRGMHIASACKSVIILTDTAEPLTLSHEVGHYFGLDHVDNEWNVMKTGFRKRGAMFNKGQLKKMRHRILVHRFTCENL